VAGVSVEEVLEFADMFAKFVGLFPSFVLVQSGVIGRVEITEADFGSDLVWLRHAGSRMSDVLQGKLKYCKRDRRTVAEGRAALKGMEIVRRLKNSQKAD
jgi:hypothetical protein